MRIQNLSRNVDDGVSGQQTDRGSDEAEQGQQQREDVEAEGQSHDENQTGEGPVYANVDEVSEAVKHSDVEEDVGQISEPNFTLLELARRRTCDVANDGPIVKRFVA